MRDSNILAELLNHRGLNNFVPISFFEKRAFSVSKDHLDDTDLYKLAISGAIEQADTNELDHLTSCQYCFTRWADWHYAINLSKDKQPMDTKQEKELDFAYGYLEAAATENNLHEPISSKSTCGHFLLSLYPQQNSQKSFMITLETLVETGKDYEGYYFQVCDSDQQLLLEGIMQTRRLARIIELSSIPDLTAWILTASAPEKATC